MKVCRICAVPAKREFVDRLIAEGRTDRDIEKRTHTPTWKEMGFVNGLRRGSIAEHRKCLAEERRLPPREAAYATPVHDSALVLAEELAPSAHDDPKDIAKLVRDRVAEGIASGDIDRFSVKDGLAAQQMLDRREEKFAERQLVITVARLLTRQKFEDRPPVLEVGETAPPYIEAEYQEVS